jgi:hypothetical protein
VKAQPFRRESQGHCFWDAEGVILLDIMPCGQTINSDLYIQTLKNLAEVFQDS